MKILGLEILKMSPILKLINLKKYKVGGVLGFKRNANF